MKDIIQIIMIIIFYGLGSIFFIFLTINQRKNDKLVKKYWEQQILEAQKRVIKEQCKRKNESEDKQNAKNK